jgi:AraC-like DNA-binding protein
MNEPMSICYREYAPQPALSGLIRCYWALRGQADTPDAALNRVLPDGCMDIVFDLAAPTGPQGLVVGAMLQARVYRHAGQVDLLGVRFVPGSASGFFGLSALTLTDTVINAAEVWSDAAAVAGRLSAATDVRHRLRHLADRLSRAYASSDRASSALVGMGLIERARGRLSVGRLCHSLQVNERTLQRSFAEQVGLTPKQAIRIVRFRQALRELGRPHTTMAAVAHSCGYADQAHFTREFRDLAAISPRDYLRERRIVGFVQDLEPGND